MTFTYKDNRFHGYVPMLLVEPDKLVRVPVHSTAPILREIEADSILEADKVFGADANKPYIGVSLCH